MAVPVEYLIFLRDQFSAAAEKIAKAARDAMKGAEGMGAAVNAAEKAVLGASAALGKGTAAMAANSRAAVQAARDHELYAKSLTRVEKIQLGMLERFQAKQQLIASGQLPGGGISSALGGMWKWYFNAQLGMMAFHGMDKAIGVVADLDTIQQKLRQGGVSNDEIKAARNASFAAQRAHPNVSITEVMETLLAARSNMTGEFSEIITFASDFADAASMFKGWEGKHKGGNAHDMIKELTAGMRTAELQGLSAPEYVKKHLQALKLMRAVFGNELNVQTYYQGASAAGQALLGTREDFRYVDFPTMMQSMRSRAGVGAATVAQKLISGIRVYNYSAQKWADLGLLDPSWLANAANLDKKGGPNIRKLGMSAMRESALLGQSPTEWAQRVILPGLANMPNLKGMGLEGLISAWGGGDAQAYNKALMGMMAEHPDAINKIKEHLGKAFSDRTAAMFMEEAILQGSRLLKARGLYQDAAQAAKAEEQLWTYGMAKEGALNSIKAVWIALGGEGFLPGVIGALNTVTTLFSGLAAAINDNPLLAEGIRWAAMAAGALLVAAALGAVGKAVRFIWAMTGIPAIFSFFSGAGRVALTIAGMTGLAAASTRLGYALRLLVGATGIGALAMGAMLAYEHWDKLRGAIQSVNNLLGIKAGQGQSLADAARARQGAWFASQEETARAARERWSDMFGLGTGAAANAAGVGASVIRIDIPQEIILRIPGVGQGSIPIRAQAPRGRAVDDLPSYQP